MILKELFENVDKTVIEWLNDVNNICVSVNFVNKRDNKQYLNDKTVSTHGDRVDISSTQKIDLTILQPCPFKFGSVMLKGSGTFRCGQLLEWKNLPDSLDGTFSGNDCPVEFFPHTITHDCHTDVKSLKGIHKRVKKIGDCLYCIAVKECMLGVILIDGLKKLWAGERDIMSKGPLSAGSRAVKATEIVNKYLGQGNSGVLKAQRELIENELDEFAEL